MLESLSHQICGDLMINEFSSFSAELFPEGHIVDEVLQIKDLK
jgi:hypothetical protein